MTEDDVAQDVGRRWMAAMRAGDWEAAWQQTDRLELPRRARQHAPGFELKPWHLRWDGAAFEGRSVLVPCLHGLGDTLQFARFVPRIAAQARELHFLVQPDLIALLQGAPGLGQVSNAWTDHPPPHEVEIEVMELAYALRASAAALAAPYPLASHVRRAGAFPLEPMDAVRVGLLWSASDWDTTRSTPFAALGPLLQVPGVRFYSLQQGKAAEEPGLAQAGVVPLHARTRAPLDAARAMLQMDLVICVDGMPAHLAATLGVPTWMLLKQGCDWRWMEARDDSPWYPAMRLFRQRSADDWEGVVHAVAQALRGFVAAAEKG